MRERRGRREWKMRDGRGGMKGRILFPHLLKPIGLSATD